MTTLRERSGSMQSRAVFAIAVTALLMLAAGSAKPFYFRMLTRDRERARAALSRVAFGKLPGYEGFLEGVRSHTAPGATIALVVPLHDWDGYSWAYYRASYVLAGRTVVPLMDPSGRALPQNETAATYIAAWQAPPPGTPLRVVWQTDRGALLRREP